MKFLRDASIRIKVLIPPAVLILALGLVSLLAIYGMGKQRAALSEVNDITLDRITLINEFVVLSEQVQSDVFQHAVLHFMNVPEEEVQSVHERLEQGLNDLDVIYGQILAKWSLDQTERSILERMKGPMDAFRLQAIQAAVVVSDNPSFGVLLVRSSTVPFAEFRATLAEFLDYQQAKIVRAETESNQRAMTIHTAIVAIASLIALAGIFTTVLVSTRLISGPILSTTDLMRRLAEGDLSIEVGGVERRDEIGAMARAVEVFRNNAIEKAQLDEELRESEDRFRRLSEATFEGITIHEQGRILDANQAFATMFGYELSEVIGMNALDFAAPESRDLVLQRILSGYEEPYEATGFRKDGATFPGELHGKAISYKGRIVRVTAIRDITERKRAEQALKEYSERLEEMVEERTKELREAQEQLIRQEKLAVLGQLAGGVAHDLRNPLGAIKNAAYFLNMVIEESDPEVKEMLEIVEKEVGTCDRIISSLLDFARPKPLMRRKVDVNGVVQDALSRAAVPENVEVVSQLDETLPAIQADPDQLAQVFGNIILNGIQAMPEGGRLVVKSEVESPEWVAVSFTDTGLGIPEENMERIFEPLFTTRAKGIGLGLALIKTLVEGHGGSVEVRSEIGKGSTFTVRLPVGGGGK